MNRLDLLFLGIVLPVLFTIGWEFYNTNYGVQSLLLVLTWIVGILLKRRHKHYGN